MGRKTYRVAVGCIVGAALLLALVPMVLAPKAAHAANGLTWVNDSGAGITYTGSWTYSTTCGTGYYQGDCHWANTANAKVTFTFTGTDVSWIGGVNTNHGMATAKICDSQGLNCGSATTVDTYNRQGSLGKQVLYSARNLSTGTHTLVVTLTGTHATGSTDYYVDVDAFIYGGLLTTTYYIDNSAGSGCSNANNGTSTSTPWCDFTNLQFEILGTGAQILLKSGDTWTQELGPLSGGGVAGNLALISSYGSGARPHIQGTNLASDRVLWLSNPDYVKISNLEISNAGAGIVAYFDSNGYNTLTFDNIYSHDIKGVFSGSPAQTDLPGIYHSPAIFITGKVPVTASDYATQNLTFSNLESYNDADPLDISGFNPGGQQGFLNVELGHHSVGYVNVWNVYFHTDDGAPNFDNLEHATITSARIDGMCQRHQDVGTTSLFFWSDTDVTIANSMIVNIPNTGSPDQTGADMEAYDDQVRFRGSYLGNNAGPALEYLILFPGDPPNYNTNNEISTTVLTGNHGGVYGDVWSYTNAVTGTASHNLYSDGSFFTDANSGGWTTSDNLNISGSSIWHAANGWTSTQGANQWSYQYWNGSSVQNMTYDSTNNYWSSNGGYLARFDWLPIPASNQWIIRTWTAPRAGTISIRGRILKVQSGGNGIQYGITQNGAWFSGYPTTLSGTDTTGVDMNFNTISVAAGDQIQFQVNAGSLGDNTNDLTSWSPSVAYTG